MSTCPHCRANQVYTREDMEGTYEYCATCSWQTNPIPKPRPRLTALPDHPEISLYQEQLQARHKTAYELREVGQSPQQISVVMGISERSVYRLLGVKR